MEAGVNKALFSLPENHENLSPGNDLDTNTEEGSYLIFPAFWAVENNAGRTKIARKPQILFQ